MCLSPGTALLRAAKRVWRGGEKGRSGKEDKTVESSPHCEQLRITSFVGLTRRTQAVVCTIETDDQRKSTRWKKRHQIEDIRKYVSQSAACSKKQSVELKKRQNKKIKIGIVSTPVRKKLEQFFSAR